MLRETKPREKAGLTAEDLPLLAKIIRIVEDGLTITSKHVSLSKVTHEADTVTKVLALALLNQDGNKVLVGFDIDALFNTQMHSKHMLFVGGQCMRERESRELVRQLSIKHTIQVVDSPTRYFENICTNPENGTGNVRHVTSELCPDVDVKA
jgi:hypothetical protein